MRAMLTKASLAALLAASLGSAPALAGGALETVDVTGLTPAPIAGRLNGNLVRIFWDPRCIPVQYRMNGTIDPIPNPLGAPFLSLADVRAELQNAFDGWNRIPTSYIDMRIVGATANPRFAGFDMTNELTFRTPAGFGAIATSPSISLISDVNLTDGADIDGDGDSDVSAALASCGDADGDGDTEFPPGFYKAGTILDNDVSFNVSAANGLRFTIDPAAIDGNLRSVDLRTVAIHEFGHSHGLSHVLNGDKSPASGETVTMFPFIDTDDPAAERDQRELDTDDIAWSSYFYPEGSAAAGPAALQAGDAAFDSVYGLITGTVTHGVLNQPVAGASVSAIDRKTGEVFASGFSGTTRVAYNPATGSFGLVSVAYNILDGRYAIPVAKGNWELAIEATDGTPVGTGSISVTAQIGGVFGQLNFNEEFWNGNKEGAIEVRTGESKNVHVNPGEVEAGIDFVTNREINVNNFGNRNFFGFTGSPAGRWYAVRIPASQISAILPGQDIHVHAAAFDTLVVDNSQVPLFAEAMLTTGAVTGPSTAAVDLSDPLERAAPFAAAENDFAPLYFKNPHELGKRIRRGIETGEITDLFLVIRQPAPPFASFSAQPPYILLDGGVANNDAPIFGLSYTSDDGVTFTKSNTYNFRFSLILSATE
ncbi:MAG TPA: matrixin family metalloprotease [Thermoanaerobaculia bacterium]